LELEDGIQVVFDSAPQDGHPPRYRSGDYWLIPARAATGDIEWPRDGNGKPLSRPPHGTITRLWRSLRPTGRARWIRAESSDRAAHAGSRRDQVCSMATMPGKRRRRIRRPTTETAG